MMAVDPQGVTRLEIPAEASWASAQDSGSWWKIPRHPRPVYSGDPAEAARMAMGLRSSTLNAATRLCRAMGHVIWAVASWARREPVPEGWRVQVTLSYVQTGAKVGRRAAEAALVSFRRWGAVDSRAGWLVVHPTAMEAAWLALEGLMGLGVIEPPEVAASVLVPAFRLDPDLPVTGRGKTRCGCEAHQQGDQDPSLLFDRARGIATCMVSRRVFVIQDDEIGPLACRIARASEPEIADLLAETSAASSTITKDTPWSGDPTATAGPVIPTVIEQHPYARDLEHAGRPGPEPRCPGISAGRLWPSGLTQSLSRASDRESWVRWQASRWGGAKGEALAWEEAAYREQGGRPNGWTPDRLVGVGWWRPGAICWQESTDGRRRWPRLFLEERGTGHVLFDVDHVDPLPRQPREQIVAGILAELTDFGLIDRVSWIIRTSSTGLQVLAQLRRFRWDPDGFYGHPSVQRFLRAAGAKVVAAVGSGQLDPSSFAPRRFGRAPGWRVKDWGPELAALWYVADEEKE
jgi:hypothetical protein